MSQPVRFLVAHTNDKTADAIRQNIEALSPTYTVFTVRTIRECMEWCVTGDEAKADILFLALELVNGQADVIFDQWVAKDCGPICVFLPAPEPGPEGRERALAYELNYLRRRATNVLDPRLNIEALVPTLALRYAREVLVAKTAAQVYPLQKRVRVLTILVALLGGVELLPLVFELFGIGSIVELVALFVG